MNELPNWCRCAGNTWSIKCRTGFVCCAAWYFSVMWNYQVFNIDVLCCHCVNNHYNNSCKVIMMIYCLRGTLSLPLFIYLTQIQLHKACMGVYKYCGRGVNWGIAQMQVHKAKTGTHHTLFFLESSLAGSARAVCRLCSLIINQMFNCHTKWTTCFV